MSDKNIPVIYGFNKSSEACPDTFAPSIFLGGCNFCCDYCMNAGLVNHSRKLTPITIEEIRAFVFNEKSKWIHISGGEITISDTDEVLNLIELFKSWGCKVSISTNGFEPEKLKMLLNHVDHVTMDVKTGSAKYDLVLKKPIVEDTSIIGECIKHYGAIYNIIKSLKYLHDRDLVNEDFSYEIRTTLYRPLVGRDEIMEIGRLIGYPTKWILQPFRKTKIMLSKRAYNVEEYTNEEIDELFALSRKYNNNVSVKFV